MTCEISTKIKTDLAPYTVTILQGYQNHIARCQALIDAGNNEPLEDGQTPDVSQLLHQQYVNELLQIINSEDIPDPALQAVPINAADPIEGPQTTEAVEAVTEVVSPTGEVVLPDAPKDSLA